MNEMLRIAVDRVKEAIALYKPSKVFALYSGGHDSRTAVEVACRVKEFCGCVHFNTGIGVEETRQFARETCHEKGWPLFEFKATENTKADGTPDPQIYDNMVRKYGFPGPAQHWRMYVCLKERGLERFMRQVKSHRLDNILLINGARSGESVRRMSNTEPLAKKGCQIWCAPVHDWEKPHIKSLFEQEGIPRNPVVECLGMSAECLCGAFAKPGELDRVATEFPYIGDRLDRLYEEVKRKFPWKWDERPPRASKIPKPRRSKHVPVGQQELPFMPMCWNCNKQEQLSKEEMAQVYEAWESERQLERNKEL